MENAIVNQVLQVKPVNYKLVLMIVISMVCAVMECAFVKEVGLEQVVKIEKL
jgi:hypothetical protein